MLTNKCLDDFERLSGHPFDEMVTIVRLYYARELLLKRVPYPDIWRLAGFKSLKEMEMEWNRLVY